MKQIQQRKNIIIYIKNIKMDVFMEQTYLNFNATTENNNI